MSQRNSVRAARNLSDPALEMIADRFKALSEPIRLKLIIQLETGERNVSELVESLGATQANISRHLQTLTDTGIISRRKEGQRAFYHISDPAVFDLCQVVCGSLKKQFERQAKVGHLFS